MHSRATIIGAITASAVLFGLANIAYRYAHGSSFVLAGQRALIGAVLFAPYTWRAARSGELKRMARHRAAIVAVVLSGATMPSSALMFTSLTGPQAALRGAMTPALLVLCTSFMKGSKSAPLFPVAICVMASVAAVLTGGLGPVAYHQLWPAGLNMALDIASILALERARNDGFSSTALVGTSMVVATLGCEVIAIAFFHSRHDVAVSGIVAATVVGVCGTAARSLRAFSLPSLGSVVAFSSSQLTSLVTALGGVLLFSDDLTRVSAVLGTIAAVAAVVAAWQAQQTEPELMPRKPS